MQCLLASLRKVTNNCPQFAYSFNGKDLKQNVECPISKIVFPIKFFSFQN